ncbi:MAG: hypothetical protein LBL59_04185 [Xanthomonadaceae bacterium]|nr:hypothetical protein [Xanthomonadaceae bacterium]
MLAVRRHDGSVFILSSPAAVARRPVPGSIRFRNAAACKQVCIPFYEQPDPLHSLDAAQARSFRNLPGIHQVIP